jgi:hypothetical protein
VIIVLPCPCVFKTLLELLLLQKKVNVNDCGIMGVNLRLQAFLNQQQEAKSAIKQDQSSL